MASNAPLAVAEVYPQLYLPHQGKRMMLTEDKSHSYKLEHYVVEHCDVRRYPLGRTLRGVGESAMSRVTNGAPSTCPLAP
jgi:hypothetical protein